MVSDTLLCSSGDPESHFEPSGRRIGDYQLGQLIGSGGMGSVYLAKQISLRRLVALKVLREDYASDPVYMERFFQEVRMLAKLEHHSIVQAIDAGVVKGVSYFAMEYVNGRDLKTELLLRRRLNETEVLTAARDIAKAMAYAWNRFRMIHRDIKPANIMRTADGTIRLLDLGISKQVPLSAQDNAELTRTGVMVGSPIYISIEQARGVKNIDFRADIYSLGVTMFHLLAGRPPYDSPNCMEIVAMHFNAPVPDLKKKCPSVSAETAKLIRWMMEKDPAARPESWETVVKQCERILQQQEESRRIAGEAAAQGKTASSRRKKTGVLLCCAGILLLLLLASGFLLLRDRMRKSAAATSLPPPPAEEKIETGTLQPPAESAGEDSIHRKDRESMRKKELAELLRLSAEKEGKKDYEGAIRIWSNYLPPEPLRDDEILKRKIEDQLDFLRRIKREREAEMLP